MLVRIAPLYGYWYVVPSHAVVITPCCDQESRGRVLRVLQVLSVFRPSVVFVCTASTRTVPKYSPYAQYT